MENKNKHLKRYIGLTVILFLLGFVLHISRLVKGYSYTIGNFEVTPLLSAAIVVTLGLMIFLGIFYLSILEK